MADRLGVVASLQGSLQRLPALKRAICGAVAAVLLAWALDSVPVDLYQPSVAHQEACTYDSGEMLLHRVRARTNSSSADNFHLALASVSAALMYNHSPPQSCRFWRVLPTCLEFLLILALGSLVGSLPLGLTSVALLLLTTKWVDGVPHLVNWTHDAEFIEPFMTLLVLLVAGLAVWRAKAPSTLRSLVLGAAIGSTLLFRSTLIFFPPLLALFAWNLLRHDIGRAALKQAVLLCLMPYLFLLPWVAMNWVVHGRLLPVESGEAAPNVIGGALGIREKSDVKLESRTYAQLQIDLTSNAEVLKWAVKEVFRHPLRYAWSYQRRLFHVIRLNPMLFALAVLGLWLHRGRDELWSVGLLAAYYVAIHCFMAFHDIYFDPLWPLLAVLGAACFIDAKKSPVFGAGRIPSGILMSCLSALFALYFFTTYVLGAYALSPRLTGENAAKILDEAIARDPGEAWLWFQRGQRRLAAGELSGAISDLTMAIKLRPDRPEQEAMLAWAHLMGGSAGPFQSWMAKHPAPLDVTDCLWRAYGYLMLGVPDVARRQIASAFNFHSSAEPCDFCGDIITETRYWLARQPSRERLKLNSEILKVAPQCGCFWLEQAWLARRAGEGGLARRALARAQSLLTDYDWHSAALLYQDIGQVDLSREILDRLIAKDPRNPALLSDMGVCQRLQGQTAAAVRTLKNAILLEPAWLPAYLTLGTIYTEQRRFEDALRLYGQALKVKPIHNQEALLGVIRRDRTSLISRTTSAK